MKSVFVGTQIRSSEQMLEENPSTRKFNMLAAQKPRILFVGPMLGRHPGWVPNPMEILAPLLKRVEYNCILTSSVLNKYLRLADISADIFRRKNDVDLVCLQVYSGRSFVVEDMISRLCAALKLPLVVVLHGGGIPAFARQFPQWFSGVLRRAQVIVTPSGFLADTVKQFGLEALVIPNILRLDEYEFKHRKRVSPRLFWMRTFYDFYNPEMAVHVLRNILPEFPDATLTLAGQDKGGMGKTKELVRQLYLEHAVRFAGFLAGREKYREFSQHDIFLNTTRVDNMPVSLLEAGASGLPIVTTNVGGIRYMVRDGESALLVPPNDIEAMTRAVRRLLVEPGLAGKLSTAGRAVAERCSAEHVVPMWQEAFQGLLSGSTDVRYRRNH